MYIIKSYSKIPKIGLDILGNDFKIEEKPVEYDAIMVHSTPLLDERFSSKCKAIMRVGAGVNNIPIERCTNEGIAVFNTPGGNANAVKELVINAIFSASRNIKESMIWLSKQDVDGDELNKIVEEGKKQFKGYEIYGKSIGIIGIGNVGARVAKACFDLGMKIYGYDPVIKNNKKIELSQFVTFYDNVEEVYKNSDYISIHMPLNASTKNFINDEAIKKMKDNVYIINYARGEIVDNNAILSAVKNGKVRGYATDFPTKSIINNEKIFCTPHLGASTYEADNNSNQMAAEEIKEFLMNGNINNSVNFPCLSLARQDGVRICMLHKNVVGMLGQITSIVANNGYNIDNLANKSRGDIAYTILDLGEDINPSTLANELNKIDNMIRVIIYE